MRLAIIFLAIAAAACGKVDSFNDAGSIDASKLDGSAGIDGKPAVAPDAHPFVCDQQACGPQDSCCPPGCNANNDIDCAPVCGDGIVEQGETCDGNCPVCAAEAYSCFYDVGDAAHCNVQCHIPITACGSGDGCCPYIANGNGACGASADGECAGSQWQYIEWPAQTWAQSAAATINVYFSQNLNESLLFTTCTPPGTAQNPIDTVITSVVDSNGNALAGDDDTNEATALPRLAGWNCAPTTTAALYESTVPTNDGGTIAGPNVFKYTITLTGFNGAAGTGVRFFVWFNGPATPNQG